MGVQFGEIIGLTNIVKKWVDNLTKKNGIIGLRNLVGKLTVYDVQCTVK